MNKPFSQACMNNRDAILDQLRVLFSDVGTVLEVGSGTGQHAAYFSRHLSHLTWQTSDLSVNHSGISQWIADEGGDNCLLPIELDVTQRCWDVPTVDAIFTANTLHIISMSFVERLFKHVGNVLNRHGLLVIYGPFNYKGCYTSESNQAFDQWLKETNPERGIRDIEWVNELAGQQGLRWCDDYAMPANNRLQVWKKTSS